ncbi:hypothetical protein [Sulfitobacter sp. JB4-11]|uniref:hypothetical protein n=1 Tax=Sulfitobacter rhodophyticola TaxID=3238304 RepID=UPI003D8193BB
MPIIRTMTDAAYSDIPRISRAPRQRIGRLPKPQPLGVPVLISDCVTPLGGETLLSLLMKRMMQGDDDDQRS